MHLCVYIVRTQETACSSDTRFRRKLRGTTGHRLLGTQRPQMLCVAAWVWFCLSTERQRAGGGRVQKERQQVVGKFGRIAPEGALGVLALVGVGGAR